MILVAARAIGISIHARTRLQQLEAAGISKTSEHKVGNVVSPTGCHRRGDIYRVADMLKKNPAPYSNLVHTDTVLMFLLVPVLPAVPNKLPPSCCIRERSTRNTLTIIS